MVVWIVNSDVFVYVFGESGYEFFEVFFVVDFVEKFGGEV